jgi:hypothetical protein
MRSIVTFLCALGRTVFARCVYACSQGANRILYPRSGGIEYRCDVVLNSQPDFINFLINRQVRLDHVGQVGDSACNPVLHRLERCLKVRGESRSRSLLGMRWERQNIDK